MHEIEQLRINLDNQQLVWINLTLAFLMFGVALDIHWSDFRKVLSSPKALFTGLVAQWFFLPAVTFLLIWIISPHPGIALGMMLVAACPGGNISNFLVHLSKGNAALSVTMTSITTVLAFLLTPFNLLFWGNLYSPTKEILKTFSLSPLDLVYILIQLVIIPLIAGIVLQKISPKITGIIRKPVRIISIILFLGLVVAALYANGQNLIIYLKYVFYLVLVHNAIAIGTGWSISRITGQNRQNTRTIMIETGIQNSGLGLIIIFNFYEGMSSMVLVTAWWAIWHLIAGFTLAIFWSRRPLSEMVVKT
jgi:bile acid:Na+ symporter, BASS family